MQIALHETITGKPIVTVGYVPFDNAWACLQERIAAHYGIPEVDADEAIVVREDDDGIERVTVDGKPVGYIVTEISGARFGEPERPVLLAAE